MDKYDDEYLMLLDLRELLRSNQALEVLIDFQKYFPDEYEQFRDLFKKVDSRKQIAALFK